MLKRSEGSAVVLRNFRIGGYSPGWASLRYDFLAAGLVRALGAQLVKGRFLSGPLGLLAILLSNVNSLHAQATTAAETSVCDVLKQTSAFDGRVMQLSGVAGNSFHQVDFWNPECPSAAMHLRFSDDYRLGQHNDKRYLRMLKKQGAVSIVIEGRFVASGGPFGPGMSRYEFRISRLIDVQKLTPEYRKRFGIGSGHTTLN